MIRVRWPALAGSCGSVKTQLEAWSRSTLLAAAATKLCSNTCKHCLGALHLDGGVALAAWPQVKPHHFVTGGRVQLQRGKTRGLDQGSCNWGCITRHFCTTWPRSDWSLCDCHCCRLLNPARMA